jgi:hypothetical protein
VVAASGYITARPMVCGLIKLFELMRCSLPNRLTKPISFKLNHPRRNRPDNLAVAPEHLSRPRLDMTLISIETLAVWDELTF